jgi:hypothetical protein
VKPLRLYILLLLILNILFIGIGYLLISVVRINLILSDVIILSAAFSLIALVTLIIFLKGQSREPESQTLYSVVSVSFKFLLELILALVWLILVKKNTLQSVIMFFVIYLTLTLFSICIILKTLKNRDL